MKRKLLIVLAVLVLFVLIFAAGSRIHGNSVLRKAVLHYEKEAGPIRPQSYAPPSPTPVSKAQGDNIAVWIKAGAELVYITMQERQFLDDLMHKDYRSWNATEKSRSVELFNRNDVALQVLKRVIRCRNSSFDLDYNSGLMMRIPNYLNILDTSKLIDTSTRLNLAEGQLSEAMKWVTTEERMAAALQHDPVLIGGLIGIAVEKNYYETVQTMLPQLDQAMLMEIQEQLKHLKSMTLPASRFLAAEGAATYHSFTHQPFPWFPTSAKDTMALPLMYRFFKRQVIANSLELYADYVTLSKRPYQNIDKSEWNPEGYMKRELQKGFFPNVSVMVERFQSAEAARILAGIAVQLCLKGHTEGSYPANLASLTSPYTGEQATYTIHSDGSATLSFPKDDAFWGSTHDKLPSTPSKPRFVWNLPAIKTS
jgi:hypothetical protein